MRVADEVHVANEFATLQPGAWVFAVPIRMTGKAIAIHSVIYSWLWESVMTNADFELGLSSKPDWEEIQVGYLFFGEQNVYARYLHQWERSAGGEAVSTNRRSTHQLFLHGLIRPVRQLFIGAAIASIGVDCAVEVYYSEVEMDRTSLDALNARFGKYRR